jgi:hypothetical protein
LSADFRARLGVAPDESRGIDWQSIVIEASALASTDE